ncbi:MAG: NAD(P)-binding domain-containing protein, partial [Clostridia bacterium]|nr:NAD(P)-binding domain-containing protein [Clostridia bacterium]
MKIGFIGAGNLATALVSGCSQAEFFSDNEFYAYDVYQPSLDNICSFGVNPLDSVKAVIECCDMVILAVKPKDFPALLTKNAGYFKAS